ncbi:hypothetical protein ACW2QC_03280 [Virgibacillus sp. FSP13]
MENQTKEREDQATELRKLVNEVQEGQANTSFDNHSSAEESTDDLEQIDWGVDILNLPPRKEVHAKDDQRTHMKISRPFIRLLLVIIITLGILVGLYYVWGDELLHLPTE